MIRYLALTISSIAVIMFSFFVQQDIKVSMDIPAEVNAGQEFIATITISKGSLESFSRFQQDLPYGLTATRVSTANADFTFENQRIRLIWLKIPAEPLITLVYRIMVDERLKGSFPLNAEFSYISGNERKNIDVKGAENIRIIPNPSLSENQLIDIKDFEKYYLAENADKKSLVTLECTRWIPEVTNSREIIVELLINKGGISKFAKIEEYIPEGFIAGEVDSKSGIFSFERGTMKILWMNLPDEQEFTVKYKLFPERGKTVDDLNLRGTFSYISENQTKIVEIVEKKSDLATINGDQKTDQVAIVEMIKEEIEPQIPVREPEPVTITEGIPDVAPEVVTGSDEKWLLKAQEGVYYRVQLAAGHKPVNVDIYFLKKAVKDNVKLEFHNGWRKYTVGSFSEYRDARDFRMHIWKSTPIKDAFVSAYNSGKRITVQEALMITNQQWSR